MTEQDQRFLDALRLEFGLGYLGYFGPRWAAKYGGYNIARPGGSGRITQHVIHHSDGALTLESVWRFHVTAQPRGRGWNSIGYHVGVRMDGSVEVAALPSHFTHGAGPVNNLKSFYVVALGDFHRAEPPAALLDSLYRVLCVCDDVISSRPWRAHREVGTAGGGGTICPGDRLFAHVKKMRGGSYGAAIPRPEHYP